MYFFFVFQIFECVRVSIIINFMNLFRQMPVNTKSKENSSRTNTSFGTCTHSGSRISTRIRDASNANYNAVITITNYST